MASARSTPALDRLPGTVDLLILRTLSRGRMHGWGISFHVRQASEDVLRLNQGALYPALHRLEERGWVRAEWGVSEHNRRARYYALTAAGRRQLARETEGWLTFVRAVQSVLQLAPA
ncbi:MAG: PadR family transcriptional regulator [Gemmatimonadetes bacterium]|nr:PadR family transcriptional regulator [Gemmatimonadota bacterium]